MSAIGPKRTCVAALHESPKRTLGMINWLRRLVAKVILGQGSSTMRPLLQATRTVPIVFPISSDPVGAGFVDSLARPGGNATGFMSFEYSLSGKWLELLKESAPTITRVAVLRDPNQGTGNNIYAIIQAMA